MMFLDKHFPYRKSFNVHTIVGLVLGFFLGFILIVLEPFGTNNFKHEYRNALLAGYGLIKFIVYLGAHFFENLVYSKDKIWNWGREITFQVLYGLCGIILAYLYHEHVINERAFSLRVFMGFLFYIALPIFPLLIFPGVLLRYFLIKNAEDKEGGTKATIHKKEVKEYLSFTGENVSDTLILERKNLLFVKSVDNYVQIYFQKEGKIENKMLRCTLSRIKEEANFLWQSHRSYLINLDHDVVLKGNSQKAYLSFLDGSEIIPVARSGYNQLKTKLQSTPED